MRQRQKALGKQTEALCLGERLLARQRYPFGEGWPQTSMVEAAYADFETILGRRCSAGPQRETGRIFSEQFFFADILR